MTQGDNRARFSTIVAPHLDDGYVLARWLARDWADAEDILQDASVRAFRAIDSFSGGSARAWVLAIVRNTAFSWLRKNRSAAFIALDDLGWSERLYAEQGGCTLQPLPTPEAELIASADTCRLEKLLAGLPAEFREVLVLRDIQGLNYRDIAQIIGAPLGTVMSRLARARQRLIAQTGEGDARVAVCPPAKAKRIRATAISDG